MTLNDWDLMYKDADRFEYGEEYEEEEFEFPDGYKEYLYEDDDYGYYGTDDKGTITLLSVRENDSRKTYNIHNGCQAIEKNAFAVQPVLETVFIPETVVIIPDGVFANGSGWAGDEPGIKKVEVSSENKYFYSDENGLYQKTDNNKKKLILYFENKSRKAFISKDIGEIAERAFFGRKIINAEFEINGYSYTFPKHSYFQEELLKDFGRNDKLYNFENYDSFILRNHFNAERIQMLCERLLQPWELSEEMRRRFIEHINASLDDALNALVKENAMEQLKLMAEALLFTQDNIFKAIDILNDTQQREMLNFLMEYRNSNFEDDDFDFSI